jgi:uncharacterized protein
MKNINLALLILSMGSARQDGERAPKEVTVVVSRKIKHGCEKDYDEWLRRLLILARKRPGYVGATTIMDDGTDSAVRHIIYRFSDRASLDAWENSEQFRKLIEEVNNYSNRYSQKATGLETWFTLPALKAIVAPPKWKMTIVAFIGSYCISSLAQYILSFFLGRQPLLFNLFMNIILVVGLTYLAMPLLSRLLRRWLYPKTV